MSADDELALPPAPQGLSGAGALAAAGLAPEAVAGAPSATAQALARVDETPRPTADLPDARPPGATAPGAPGAPPLRTPAPDAAAPAAPSSSAAPPPALHADAAPLSAAGASVPLLSAASADAAPQSAAKADDPFLSAASADGAPQSAASADGAFQSAAGSDGAPSSAPGSDETSATRPPSGGGGAGVRRMGHDLFGLVEAGGALLAVPADCIREVTALRPLSRLPGDAPALRGALDLRGDIIPVLALDQLLGLPETDSTDPSRKVVLVLRRDGWLVGLLADVVRGMKRARPEEAAPLRGPTGGLADRAILVAGRSAAALDPARLFAIPGLPRVAERTSATVADSRQGGRDALLTFESQGVRLAVEALRVDAALPDAEVRITALTSGWCHGHIDHHGRRVAILDTLDLLQIAPPRPPRQSTEALVLRLGDDLLVALEIDRVCDIRRVSPDEFAALPDLGVSEKISALLAEPDSETLVIDFDAFAADEDIRAVARGAAGAATTEAQDRAEAAQGRAKADHRPYLVFHAGADYAAPLSAISEIIPFPDRIARLPLRREGLLGGFAHRGVTVPLFDLAHLLGRPSEDRPRYVLLVGESRGRRGYAIHMLNSVEPGAWKVDDRGDIVGRSRNLVMLGAGSGRRLMTGVDLAELAADA